MKHRPSAVNFFIPIERVDPEKRIVAGYAYTTARVRGDRYNLKRSAMEKAAARYMQMPCIRAMHQPIAAGKALNVTFDDKGAFIEAYIGDDNEWQKCVDGIYRGFSVFGNPLICRGADIEEFDWVETSLVDRPKDHGALFTVLRVDGLLDESQEGEINEELADNPLIELPEDASDEQVELARAELEGVIARGGNHYNPAQPRDEIGRWTIVRGHRVSTTGAHVGEKDIHEAVGRFGLDETARKKLLAAHAAGHIENDHHLYRAIAHAIDAHDSQNYVTTGTNQPGPWHWDAALKAHAKGGTHENKRTWGAPHEGDYKHLTDSELASHLHDEIGKAPKKSHAELHKGERVIHNGNLYEVTKTIHRKKADGTTGTKTVKAKLVHPDTFEVSEAHGVHSLHSHHPASDLAHAGQAVEYTVPTNSIMGAAAELRRRQKKAKVARAVTSDGVVTSDEVPVRENLEGGHQDKKKMVALCNSCREPYGDGEACQHCGAMHEKGDPEPVERSDADEFTMDDAPIESAIGNFVGLLWDAYDGPDTEATIMAAISTAQATAKAILTGDNSDPTVRGDITPEAAPDKESIARLETENNQLIESNTQLLQRAELAESSLEELRQQLDQVGSERQSIEAELATVRTSEETAVSRLENATGEVSRLEGEVARLTDELEQQAQQLNAEIEKLRKLPIKRNEDGQSGSVAARGIPMARAFAANAVLDPPNPALQRKAQLQEEHQQLQRALISETDAAKREAGATRLISINEELARL